jgi:hypothetical protein
MRNLIARWIPGRIVSTQTEKCYAATSDCADVAVRFFGVQTRKVEVAPLGVDTELMSPIATVEQSEQRAALRSRVGVAQEEVLFIYTGQFTTAKNLLILPDREATRPGRRSGHFSGRRSAAGPDRNWIEHRPAAVPHRELVANRAADVAVWTQESTSMLDAAARAAGCRQRHVARDREDGR